MKASRNLNTQSSAHPSFALWPAIAALILLEGFVLLQAWLSYRGNFLTVSQMQQSRIEHGLPFAWHFGMWGDALIISPMAAFFVGRFLFSWRFSRMLIWLAFGIATATAMSWSYTLSDIPEAHAQNHVLTPAGIAHLVYMSLALAVLALFAFATENVSAGLLRIASVLVIVHVILGTHMVLGVLKLLQPLDWYPDQPLESAAGWTIITVVAIGLIWRNIAQHNPA